MSFSRHKVSFATSIAFCLSAAGVCGTLMNMHEAQFNEEKITYALPSDGSLLGAGLKSVVAFPAHRPFPQSCSIARIGLGVHREEPGVHQVRAEIVAHRFSKPYFASGFTIADLPKILEMEQTPAAHEKKSRTVVTDSVGRKWLRVDVAGSGSGELSDRSYITTIAPDVTLSLRLNVGRLATEEERKRGFGILEEMWKSLRCDAN